MSDTIVGDIVSGANFSITDNFDDKSKPFVCRGVIKRKYIHACQNEGRDFYYTDTGYFGNFISEGNPSGKKIWVRLVKNELQKSTIEDRPADRWNNLVKGDPRLKWTGWKTRGRKILFILPNPKSCDFFGIDFHTWKENTLETIRKNTDMPIVTREKGSRGERNHHTIYNALDDGVFATVAFNSIAAMESIAYGIPAFVSVSCAALPLASTDLTRITKPYYPDERLVKTHCHNLAYGQFTSEEICNGTAWKLINL
jgi:hypothetical protein